ncbi:MAG: PTS sugar transporter subunit IIA [Verrucomicrobiota bacterium]|nr:PTS sugar transporter subunit IIA [Verrucomicrobiota bacterium]
MNLKLAITNACCFPNLSGTTKKEIIEEMINLMATAGKLSDPKAALSAVLEREKRMSTGMQAGIALPHGKTAGLQEIVVAFAIRKEGVDFGSIDGQPTRIFALTLSHPKATDAHIQILAAIGKLLNSAEVRSRLLQAETAEDMVHVLQSAAEAVGA